MRLEPTRVVPEGPWKPGGNLVSGGILPNWHHGPTPATLEDAIGALCAAERDKGARALARHSGNSSLRVSSA